jgi:hypothetical protein
LGYSKISRISAKVSLPLLSKSTSGEYSSMDDSCWTCIGKTVYLSEKATQYK